MASRVFLLGLLFTVLIRTAASSEADFGLSIAASAGASVGAAVAKSAPPLPYTFAEEPGDVVVRRNSTVELRCAAHLLDDNTSVTFWWTHDGLRIPLPDSTARIKLLSSGNLLINKVTRGKKALPLHHRGELGDHGDQGIYRCMIEGPLGTLRSRPARLTLAALSHDITIKSTTETVGVGGTARLECFTESDPPALFTWERADSGEMPPNKYFQLPAGILLIADVQPEDALTYRCVAYNHVLNKTRKSANLTIVLEQQHDNSTKFLSNGRNLQLKAGENVTLECSVQFSPENTPMKWVFVNKSVKTVLTTNRTARGVSILELTNISLENAGSYQCSYGIQPHSQSQVTVLNVSTPPVIVKRPQSLLSPAAKTARFPCEATGVPTPNVTFFKDGVRLKTSGRFKVRDVRAELVLLHTVKDDSGLYQCVATNEAGEVWDAARLTVNAKGGEPPINLTCSTDDEPNTINLSWKASNPKTKQLGYTIHYTPTEGGEEKNAVALVSPGSVTNLLPYTNYSFYVRSYASNAASEPSPKVVCQTEEGVPTDIPHLTLHLTGSNKLLVLWAPLPRSKANGVITEYQVMWRREKKGRQTTNVASVPGNTTEYVIEDLQPGKKYDIRVIPGTKKGFLIPNSSRHNWTSIEMPLFDAEETTVTPANVTSPVALYGDPDTPMLLESKAATLYAIDVSWNSPEPKPKYYVVYYCLLSSKKMSSVLLFNESTAKTIWSNETSAQLTELIPGSLYGVRVKAYYEDGQDGPTSNLLECRTLPDYSDSVLDVYWEILNETSVRVSWKEPADADETLQGYNLTYGTDPDGCKLYDSIILRKNETSAVMEGLTPGVEYVIQVIAVMAAGLGASSTVKVTIQHHNDWAELGFLLLKVVPAVLCVLACAAYSVYRWRCSKSPSRSRLDNVAAAGSTATMAQLGKHCASPGQANHVNGSAHHHDLVTSPAAGVFCKPNAGMHEMALLTPPLSNTFSPPSTLSPAAASHIDTKGAPCGISEEPENAVNTPLLNGSAACISIHITENPQYNSWMKTNRPNADLKSSFTESVTLLPLYHPVDKASSETGGSDTEHPFEENEDDVLNETQFTDVENSFQLHHNNNKSSNDSTSMLTTKGRPISPPAPCHNYSERKSTFEVGDILSTSG